MSCQRLLSDYDWRIAFEAAENVLNAQPIDIVNTPEVKKNRTEQNRPLSCIALYCITLNCIALHPPHPTST